VLSDGLLWSAKSLCGTGKLGRASGQGSRASCEECHLKINLPALGAFQAQRCPIIEFPGLEGIRDVDGALPEKFIRFSLLRKHRDCECSVIL
jgi:hypothetical protein